MRTISRHRPRSSPSGDVVCLCTYCGVAWYRSQLTRDAANNLACPDDAAGLDDVTLSLGNAENASQHKRGRYNSPQDGTFETPNTVPAPPFIFPDGRRGTF